LAYDGRAVSELLFTKRRGKEDRVVVVIWGWLQCCGRWKGGKAEGAAAGLETGTDIRHIGFRLG